MSQYNNPYLPNGQAMPQSQGTWYPQSPGFPAAYSQPGGFPGQRSLNGQRGLGMQGVAPGMQAFQQQPGVDPNGGEDIFSSIIPGPKEAAMGAVGGAGIAFALNQLEDRKAFDTMASGIEQIPGLKQLSKAMTERLKTASTAKTGFWTETGWLPSSLRELVHLDTFAAIEQAWAAGKGATDETFQAAVQDATKQSVNAMQRRQLTAVLGNFKKRFPAGKDAETAYQKLHADAGSGAVNLLKPEDWLHKGEQGTFKSVLSQVDTQLDKLTEKKNKTAAEKALQKKLHNLKERIGGLNEHYLPVYTEQTKLSARLQLKGIGPVGRVFANGANYLKRIFNGDTLRMNGNVVAEGATPTAMQTMKSTLSKFALPGLAGALIFGCSIKKAEKAKDGEKTRTFFHDFLGTAIGNFIGWEFGRKVLNSFQVANKVLGKQALNTLPRVFGRTIPLLGSITLGGFATEMVAMFVIGGLFQNVAEKISDAIFGKPSEESLKGKGAQSALQPNPVMLNMAMQQAVRQPQFRQPMQAPQFQQSMRQQQLNQQGYGRPYFEGAPVPGQLARDQIQQRLITRPLPNKMPKMPGPDVPSPKDIGTSEAAKYSSAVEDSVVNSAWDPHNHIDPFDKHGI